MTPEDLDELERLLAEVTRFPVGEAVTLPEARRAVDAGGLYVTKLQEHGEALIAAARRVSRMTRSPGLEGKETIIVGADDFARTVLRVKEMEKKHADECVLSDKGRSRFSAEVRKLRSELAALKIADAKRTVTLEYIHDSTECIHPGDDRGCPEGSECPYCTIAPMVIFDKVAAARKLLEGQG